MSIRHSDNGESLDLLLDTLCNTFAALIFIAILLVIINQDATAPKDSSASTVNEAKVELLQRQIANLSAEIARLSAATPQNVGGTTQPDQAATEEIKKEIRKLEARLRELESALAAGQKNLSDGAKNDVEALRAEADQIKSALDKIKIANTASKAELNRLGKEQEMIERQLADAKLPAKETYRLPKERGDGGKEGTFVFIRGGKMYPLFLFPDQSPQRNERTIRWREEGDRNIPEVITSLGWDPQSLSGGELDQFLSSVPKSRFYLSFIVWPDSFAEFRTIKQECTRRAIEVGFEVRTGRLPALGPTGRGPAPRL